MVLKIGETYTENVIGKMDLQCKMVKNNGGLTGFFIVTMVQPLNMQMVRKNIGLMVDLIIEMIVVVIDAV